MWCATRSPGSGMSCTILPNALGLRIDVDDRDALLAPRGRHRGLERFQRLWRLGLIIDHREDLAEGDRRQQRKRRCNTERHFESEHDPLLFASNCAATCGVQSPEWRPGAQAGAEAALVISPASDYPIVSTVGKGCSCMHAPVRHRHVPCAAQQRSRSGASLMGRRASSVFWRCSAIALLGVALLGAASTVREFDISIQHRQVEGGCVDHPSQSRRDGVVALAHRRDSVGACAWLRHPGHFVPEVTQASCALSPESRVDSRSRPTNLAPWPTRTPVRASTTK